MATVKAKWTKQRDVTDIFFRQQEKTRSKTPFERIMDDLSQEGKKNYNRNNQDSCCLGIDKTNYFKTSYKESQNEIVKETNKLRALTKPKANEETEECKEIGYFPKPNWHTRIKTTGGLFVDQNNSKANRLELNKSNIFHDPEKEILNRALTMTTIFKPSNQKDKSKENTPEPINKQRRRIKNIFEDEDALVNRINQTMTASHNFSSLTARERKLKNNQGHFPSQYNDYKPRPPPIEAPSVDDSKKKELIKKYTGISENQRKADEFEVMGIQDIQELNMRDIQKAFHDNGLHIYNEKTDSSYYDGKNKGKLMFKVRKCDEDKTYGNKVTKISKYLKTNKGITINQVDSRKKDYYYKGYTLTAPNISSRRSHNDEDEEKPRWK